MTDLKESPAWQALAEHQQEVGNLHMRDLFTADPQRSARFSLCMGDILFDYSKNRITEKLNIPTGVPLVYELDEDLQPIQHYYLGDPEEIRKAQEAVAAQGKAKN